MAKFNKDIPEERAILFLFQHVQRLQEENRRLKKANEELCANASSIVKAQYEKLLRQRDTEIKKLKAEIEMHKKSKTRNKDLTKRIYDLQEQLANTKMLFNFVQYKRAVFSSISDDTE